MTERYPASGNFIEDGNLSIALITSGSSDVVSEVIVAVDLRL